MHLLISKYVIVSLIVGLVLGFFGGYGYNNLNAGAPVINSPSSNQSVVKLISEEKILSDFVGSAINIAIRQEIAAKGIDKILGQEAAITALNTSVMQKLSNIVIPTAQAQKRLPECKGANLKPVLQATAMFLDVSYDIFTGKCDKYAQLDGQLDITVYRGTNPDGSPTVGWRFNFDGTIQKYGLDPKNCSEKVETINISSTGDGGSHSDNEKAVCKVSTHFTHTLNNPKFDCPCKKGADNATD